MLGMSPDEYKNRFWVVEGTPDQCIHAIKRYIERGVTLFTLLGFSEPKDCDIFAKEIMPELRRAY
ncbi:MAG: hypothetical protein QXE26_02205 [Candidatus Bathyarchaeia archaeon]